MGLVVREWVATEEAVTDSIRAARAAGQLVRVERIPAPAGLVGRRVVLRAEPAAGRPSRGQLRARWACGGAAAGLVVGVPAGWAARWLLTWLWLHRFDILGWVAALVVVALVVWYLLGRAGRCPRRFHCPGCACA